MWQLARTRIVQVYLVWKTRGGPTEFLQAEKRCRCNALDVALHPNLTIRAMLAPKVLCKCIGLFAASRPCKFAVRFLAKACSVCGWSGMEGACR